MRSTHFVVVRFCPAFVVAINHNRSSSKSQSCLYVISPFLPDPDHPAVASRKSGSTCSHCLRAPVLSLLLLKLTSSSSSLSLMLCPITPSFASLQLVPSQCPQFRFNPLPATLGVRSSFDYSENRRTSWTPRRERKLFPLLTRDAHALRAIGYQ